MELTCFQLVLDSAIENIIMYFKLDVNFKLEPCSQQCDCIWFLPCNLFPFFPSSLSCRSLKSNVTPVHQEKCTTFTLFSFACQFVLYDVQENYCLASHRCLIFNLPPCSLCTAKSFLRFGESIVALPLHKMVKWRRMWKDRLLSVLFHYNLYSVSAAACHSALGLEVLQDNSKLPWEWMFTLGGV